MLYPGGGYPGLYFPAQRVGVEVLPEYIEFDVRICREIEATVDVEREIIECSAAIDRTLTVSVAVQREAPTVFEAEVEVVRDLEFRAGLISKLTLSVAVDR